METAKDISNPIKEIEAMREIVSALHGLSPASIRRILMWAWEVFTEPPQPSNP